eukprot:TRINITY_DN13804_c0_g3_i1.p1 TRINITY_DN13804_c0_g3~~TRINITY_DN13804_c0_g3_i1.p1  ORF type:complete len:195 (-),score=53.06 TRINITY_DN13804_c0_g3_i1:281-865(-)
MDVRAAPWLASLDASPSLRLSDVLVSFSSPPTSPSMSPPPRAPGTASLSGLSSSGIPGVNISSLSLVSSSSWYVLDSCYLNVTHALYNTSGAIYRPQPATSPDPSGFGPTLSIASYFMVMQQDGVLAPYPSAYGSSYIYNPYATPVILIIIASLVGVAVVGAIVWFVRRKGYCSRSAPNSHEPLDSEERAQVAI